MINTTALSFLGDAVYEVYIRKHVLEKGQQKADRMHRLAVKYVRAESQAKAVRRLMEGFLTEEEMALVKRARNHKTSARSRSADVLTYKMATAFEALVGFLSLGEDRERLEQVVFQAVKIIEGEEQ